MTDSSDIEGDGLSISFNQDNTCACIANSSGIAVYSFDCSKIVFTMNMGPVRLCRMLFSTSLLAYVGSGEQVNLSPRRLSLLNTKDQKVIQHLNFKSTVLAIRLNMTRLVAVLEREAVVYALESLELVTNIGTSENRRGVCALTNTSSSCYLALPAQATGGIQVVDADGQVVADIPAHKSSLACVAISEDMGYVASASEQGTVIRVHSLPQGVRTHQFRRGSTAATINCLTFYSDSFITILACTSSNGTVHIWRMDNGTRQSSSGLMSVMPTSMTNMVEPQRCLLGLRIPSGIPMECILKRWDGKLFASDSSLTESTSSVQKVETQITLVVVTKAGMLYRYGLHNLVKGQTPFYQLEREQSLVNSSSNSLYL